MYESPWEDHDNLKEDYGRTKSNKILRGLQNRVIVTLLEDQKIHMFFSHMYGMSYFGELTKIFANGLKFVVSDTFASQGKDST